MDVREKLVWLLPEYFDIGDSYAYNLTRVKSAFACGTMGLDDFEEFDEETVEDVANHLIAHGVMVQECAEWEEIEDDWNMETIYKCSACKEEFVTIDGTPADNLWNYCPHCGAKMTPQPPKGE